MKAITTREDAINFIHGCIIWIGPAFHPDTPMPDYTDGEGKLLFPMREGSTNHKKLEKCFKILGDEIYTAGMDLMVKLGYAPAIEENGEKQSIIESIFSAIESDNLELARTLVDRHRENRALYPEIQEAISLLERIELVGQPTVIDWNAEVARLREMREKAIQFITTNSGIYPKGEEPWYVTQCHFKKANNMPERDIFAAASLVQKAIAERANP